MSKTVQHGEGKQYGTVKWFSAAKGYGFIGCEQGDDIFVHHTAIQAEGYRELKEGDRVSFEVEAGSKGKPQAVRVSRVTEEDATLA